MLPLATIDMDSKIPSDKATLPPMNGVIIPPKPSLFQSIADRAVGTIVPDWTIDSNRLIRTSQKFSNDNA